MGFLSRLFGKLGPDDFGAMVFKAIQAAGETRQIVYSPDDFSIRIEAKDGGVFYLANVYKHYQSLTKEGRQGFLKAIVRTWFSPQKELPSEFEDVGPDLMPIVRSRAYFELNSIRFALDGTEETAWPHEVVGDHLAIGLAYDLPHAMRNINADDLAKWNVSLYEALETARRNLAEREQRVAKIGEGLYLSAAGDSYDSSRLILLDLIRQLSVKGDTIAIAPSREMLIVTGSDDEVGLAGMAQLAAKALEERPITVIAFRLEQEDWRPWLPERNHAQFNAFNRMRIESLGQDYAEQKGLLEAKHAKEETDIFVASYSAVQNEKNESLTSYSIWANGVLSLLPESDLVAFAESVEQSEPLFVPWNVVRDEVGDLMKPQDMYPERYRIDEFPTAKQLERLKQSAVVIGAD